MNVVAGQISVIIFCFSSLYTFKLLDFMVNVNFNIRVIKALIEHKKNYGI
jgi:hypothetical protein